MIFLDFAWNDKRKILKRLQKRGQSRIYAISDGRNSGTVPREQTGLYIMIAIFIALGGLAVAGVERTKRGIDHSIALVREEKKLLDEQQVKIFKKMPAVVTAYSSTEEETDDTPDITATGKTAGWGAIAVDPSEIPMGSMIYVPGYGWGEAVDIGGKVKGRMIDIWMESPAKAREWGRRIEIVFVVRPEYLKNEIPR